MSERAKITAKTSDAKKENSVSQTKKNNLSKSANSPIDEILFLQRTVGNHAVETLLKSGVIRAKLTIGQPGDIYEQGADRVADQVMRMQDPSTAGSKGDSEYSKVPSIQRMCTECEEEVHRQKNNLGLGHSSQEELHRQPMEEEEELVQPKSETSEEPIIQRKEEEEEEEKKEEELLQMKEVSSGVAEVSPTTESQINSIRGDGQSLPESVRAFFEPRFGQDFSQVRVHTDAKAAQSAQAVNARAYTVGHDVVFGAGEFQPHSTDGKRLLAHELAHVIHQTRASGTASLQSAELGSSPAPSEILMRQPAVGIRTFQDRREALEDLTDPFALFPPLPSSLKRTLRWIGDEGLPVRLTRAVPEKLNPTLDPWRKLRPWLQVAQRQAWSFPARKRQWQAILEKSSRTEDPMVVQGARALADALPGLVGDRWIDLQHMLAFAINIAEASALQWRNGFASLDRSVAAMLDSLGPDVIWTLRVFADLPWVSEALRTVLNFPGADHSGAAIVRWISALRQQADELIRGLNPPAEGVKSTQFMTDALAAVVAQKPATVSLRTDLHAVVAIMDQPEGFILQRAKLATLLPRVRQQIDALDEPLLTAADGPGFVLGSFCSDLQIWSRAPVLVFFSSDFDWVAPVAAQIDVWAREQEPEIFGLTFNSLRGIDTWSALVEETVAEEETLDEPVPTLPRGWWDISAHLAWLFRSKNAIVQKLLKKLPLLRELIEQANNLWQRAAKLFERFKQRIFKEGRILAPLWEFFLGVLGLEVPEEFVSDVSQRGGSLLGKILRHPIRFLRNLALGIKGGLQGFRERIGEHLLNGFIEWLLDEFELTPPLTIGRVISALMKRIGFNRRDVCDRIAVYLTKETGRKTTGAEVEERIDQVIKIIDQAIKGGTTALRWLKMLWAGQFAEFWQEIKDYLAEAWQWVVDRAIEFVVEQVKKGLLTKLIKLLDPSGIMAVLTAIKTIYDAIKTVIAYAERMLAMIREVFRAVREIAEGKIERAAAWVEGALAKGVAVAVAFLARFLGLGSVVEHLKKALEKARAVVHKVLDVLIKATGEAWKWLMKKVEEIKEWWKSRRKFSSVEGETRDLYFYPEAAGKDATLYVSPPQVKGKAAALGTPETLVAYLVAWEPKLKTDKQKGVHGEVTRVSKEIDEIKAKKSMSIADGEMIYVLFNEIVIYLSELGMAYVPPATDVTWDTKRIDGEEHGGSMVANPLSIDPGGYMGSKPVASETKLWKAVKQHKTPGGATYYIQGHLLNHHLHGAGVWKNMAPIARSTNTDMERDTEGGLKEDGPEGLVKKAVLGENKVVRYEVEMVYSGSHIRTPRTQAEAKLPRKIIMKAWVLEPRAGKWQKKGSSFLDRKFDNQIRPK